MKTAVITCTGDRPEAFALCQKWVANQTYKDFLWIVIDDGVVPSFFNHRFENIIYASLDPEPGVNTLARNFTRALEIVETSGCEYVAVMEDDDFYSERYLQDVMTHAGKGYSVIGEQLVEYIHTSGKHYALGNRSYAPLAATAFNRDLIPLMKQCVADPSPYKTFDLKFWREVVKEVYSTKMVQDYNYYGIKGMPGRSGIGKGHRPGVGWTSFSMDDLFLPEALVDAYKPFMEK